MQTAQSIPYWLADPPERLPRPAREVTPEVVIVGGGVTGCSCALALARAGVAVRLQEARQIAAGASGRNGGFVLRGGAQSYHVARHQIGNDAARSLWRFTERHVDRLEELAGDAFRRAGSLRVAAEESECRELRAEYEALVNDGFAAEWIDELAPPLAGRFHGALHHPLDGTMQPVRWVRRLARLAAEAGADIREQAPVESVASIPADVVVLALDGYTAGLLPELEPLVRPTRGQVAVTEPLPELLFSCPHYARWGYDYWQQTSDGRLVVGGWRDASLETEYTLAEETTPLIQSKIEAFIVELLGRPARVTHRWAGIFGSTPDRLPLVGRLPGSDRVWIAGGYSGHGNVLGLACGELVAEAILGRPDPLPDLFEPSRLVQREQRPAL